MASLASQKNLRSPAGETSKTVTSRRRGVGRRGGVGSYHKCENVNLVSNYLGYYINECSRQQ